MNENEHNNHQQEGLNHANGLHDHRPYWKRIHHTWSFWIFLFLMLAAIIYYVMSVDFAFVPHKQLKQPSENNITP